MSDSSDQSFGSLRPCPRLLGAGEAYKIGRNDTCNLVLPTNDVSRIHAEIALIDDEYEIRDLGSHNGTFLNGDEVKRPTKLKPGDRIEIGSYEFGFNGSGLMPVQGIAPTAIKQRRSRRQSGLNAILAARRGPNGRPARPREPPRSSKRLSRSQSEGRPSQRIRSAASMRLRRIRAATESGGHAVAASYLRRIVGFERASIEEPTVLPPLPRSLPSGRAALRRKDPYAELYKAAPKIDTDFMWLQGDGVKLLREQKFAEADAYFKKAMRERPHSVEGTLGMGAVKLVRKDTDGAMELFIKGSRTMVHSLAGELLATVGLGDAATWVELAEYIADYGTAPALICALSLLEQSLRSKEATADVQARAARDYQRALRQLRRMNSKYALEASRMEDEETSSISGPIKIPVWLVAAVLLVALVWGVLWFILLATQGFTVPTPR